MASLSSSGAKRKRVVLSIEQKVDIIRKVEQGETRANIQREFNIGKTTVVDILKAKHDIFKFYAATETNKGLAKRETLGKAKLVELDEVLWEWYRMKRSDGKDKPIAGWMIVEKAKELHHKMNISEPCNLSDGWLRNFKMRRGIRKLTIADEKTLLMKVVHVTTCLSLLSWWKNIN